MAVLYWEHDARVARFLRRIGVPLAPGSPRLWEKLGRWPFDALGGLTADIAHWAVLRRAQQRQQFARLALDRLRARAQRGERRRKLCALAQAVVGHNWDQLWRWDRAVERWHPTPAGGTSDGEEDDATHGDDHGTAFDHMLLRAIPLGAEGFGLTLALPADARPTSNLPPYDPHLDTPGVAVDALLALAEQHRREPLLATVGLTRERLALAVDTMWRVVAAIPRDKALSLLARVGWTDPGDEGDDAPTRYEPYRYEALFWLMPDMRMAAERMRRAYRLVTCPDLRAAA